MQTAILICVMMVIIHIFVILIYFFFLIKKKSSLLYLIIKYKANIKTKKNKAMSNKETTNTAMTTQCHMVTANTATTTQCLWVKPLLFKKKYIKKKASMQCHIYSFILYICPVLGLLGNTLDCINAVIATLELYYKASPGAIIIINDYCLDGKLKSKFDPQDGIPWLELAVFFGRMDVLKFLLEDQQILEKYPKLLDNNHSYYLESLIFNANDIIEVELMKYVLSKGFRPDSATKLLMDLVVDVSFHALTEDENIVHIRELLSYGVEIDGYCFCRATFYENDDAIFKFLIEESKDYIDIEEVTTFVLEGNYPLADTIIFFTALIKYLPMQDLMRNRFVIINSLLIVNISICIFNRQELVNTLIDLLKDAGAYDDAFAKSVLKSLFDNKDRVIKSVLNPLFDYTDRVIENTIKYASLYQIIFCSMSSKARIDMWVNGEIDYTVGTTSSTVGSTIISTVGSTNSTKRSRHHQNECDSAIRCKCIL
jgi:hypothetical protein